MKKVFLTLCVALLSMGAQAQEKGDFALGVKGGLAIAKIEFGTLFFFVTLFLHECLHCFAI